MRRIWQQDRCKLAGPAGFWEAAELHVVVSALARTHDQLSPKTRGIRPRWEDDQRTRRMFDADSFSSVLDPAGLRSNSSTEAICSIRRRRGPLIAKGNNSPFRISSLVTIARSKNSNGVERLSRNWLDRGQQRKRSKGVVFRQSSSCTAQVSLPARQHTITSCLLK